MQRESLQSTGRTFQSFATCGASALTIYRRSISSVAGSRVSPIVRRENDAEAPTLAICGLSSGGLFAALGPDGCWRKMYQGYVQLMLDGSSEEFLETWPASAMMRNGSAYLLPPSVPRMAAREYSLWPTPTVTMARDTEFTITQCIKRLRRNQRDGYQTGLASGSLTDRVTDELGGYPTAEFVEWLMGFPLGWTDCED